MTCRGCNQGFYIEWVEKFEGCYWHPECLRRELMMREGPSLETLLRRYT